MTSTGGSERHGARKGLDGPADLDGEHMLTLDSGPLTPWRRAPEDRRIPRSAKVSAAVEALIAAGVGVLVLPGLGQLQRQVLLRSDTLFVVGLVLSVGAAFGLAAGVHRWLGGGRRRDAGAVGAVSAALAGTAWGAIATSGAWAMSAYLPPTSVLWAAALGAAVLAVRTSGVGARVAGGVAGAATLMAVVSCVHSGWPLVTTYLPPQPAAAAHAPVDVAQEDRPPEQTTAPPPPSSPVLGDLCHPDELEMSTTRPETGGNDVAVTLTADNVGSRECVVTGWPTVRLFSDGEDLALNVQVRESPPAGEHVDPLEISLAPGERAQTQVWWPSWGAAADLDAAQQLWIGVGGGVEAIALPEGARWDVVRSAEAYVAPWQAGESPG